MQGLVLGYIHVTSYLRRRLAMLRCAETVHDFDGDKNDNR